MLLSISSQSKTIFILFLSLECFSYMDAYYFQAQIYLYHLYATCHLDLKDHIFVEKQSFDKSGYSNLKVGNLLTKSL